MSEAGLGLRLARQFGAFFGVGIAAAVMHYGLLIGLVEWGGFAVIPATLTGYVAGGMVSYWLNRAVTYDARRGHVQAGWRFAVVASLGFLMTWGLMSLFNGRWGVPYLPAQLATTGIVLIWSFLAHKYWSFGERL